MIKDITADDEGMGDKAADDMGKDMDMDKDMDGDKDAEDMEDRVVDLEDALDELKAEFDAMMADKKDGDDEDKDEAVEIDFMKRDHDIWSKAEIGELKLDPFLELESITYSK